MTPADIPRRFPRLPDGSVDYQAIIRQFEADQAANGSPATDGETDTPVRSSEESEGSAVSAGSPESEARALLDRMLSEGATFQVIREAGADVLIWFGSAATVTDEVRAEVARLKPEIIRLFLRGSPRSRRTWGEP